MGVLTLLASVAGAIVGAVAQLQPAEVRSLLDDVTSRWRGDAVRVGEGLRAAGSPEAEPVVAAPFVGEHLARGRLDAGFAFGERHVALVELHAQRRARALDPRGRPIIVYCGGGDCEASKNLAYSAIDLASKPDAFGRRAYEAMERAFHDPTILDRPVGESMDPALPAIGIGVWVEWRRSSGSSR